MPVPSKSQHRGAFTCNISVAGELSTNGQRRVGLCARRRVLCTPNMNSYTSVNWILVREVWVLWNKKSALLEVARAMRAPCLVVHENGI
jgi:hypothetical protein